jgi:hypothetical protein
LVERLTKARFFKTGKEWRCRRQKTLGFTLLKLYFARKFRRLEKSSSAKSERHKPEIRP